MAITSLFPLALSSSFFPQHCQFSPMSSIFAINILNICLIISIVNILLIITAILANVGANMISTTTDTRLRSKAVRQRRNAQKLKAEDMATHF
jgi:hypothetical protein